MSTKYLFLGRACLLWFLFLPGNILAQEPRSEMIPVGPNSTVRSTSFHLEPGDTVNVTFESKDDQFAVDLYIYSAAKELFGKDDEESSSSLFSWMVPIEGDYYVLARNL